MSLSKFRIRNFLPVVAVLAVAVIAGAPTQARAALELSWSVNNTVLNDDPTNTSITISASAGGFGITGSAVGANSGAFGPGTTGIDLSTISITANGPSTLTLYLTENGLSSPTGTGTLSTSLTGHFITGTGTVSMVGYGNDTNLAYGNGTGQGGTSPLVSPPGNVATSPIGLGGSAGTTFSATAPYSITEILTINFTSSGSVSLSSDGSTTFSSPAPSALLLLLSGSPVFGLGCWLRRRKSAPAA